VLGRPDRSSLTVEVLPFLKRPNHSKVRLRLMHESPKACFNISSFTSRFTQSHTELDAHPLFVNFRHTADIRKSQTVDAIHTQRHVQQSNASTSNHATRHTHSQNSIATHPGWKLVNYKRLACHEHCPGLLDTPSYIRGVTDCNEWKTEKRHECTNMGNVKRLELRWQLYVTSLAQWDVGNTRPL